MNEEDTNQLLFFRQRRNLIGISLLLALYLVAGLEIQKLSILGNEIGIPDPVVLQLCLWAVWFWWLIRYCQYFLVTPNKFRVEYENRFARTVLKIATRHFTKDFAAKRRKEGENEWAHIFEVKQHNFLDRNPLVWNLILTGPIAYKHAGGHGTAQIHNAEQAVHRKDLLWAKLKAFFIVCLGTPRVTDYIAPFLIAMIPLAYLIYKHAPSFVGYIYSFLTTVQNGS